ncbi:MAG: squalene synthase HpnC [Streptosporangiaceae bacterium]
MTRGATPISHGRGPLSALPANRSQGSAVHAAVTPEGTPATSGPATSGPAGDERAALVAAGAAAQAPAENFPVALRMLPARYRRHLMAVYRFARTVDDIGDEALPAVTEAPLTATTEQDVTKHRLHLLDELDHDIARLYAGAAPGNEVIAQLAPTVTECGVPAQLFQDLIQANRQDQRVTRYRTFDDLAGYCRLSANPVGRIVLYVFGAFTPQRASLSDHVCTALQLAEHWQDVAEDYANGRIYLPTEDLDAFHCPEADLAEPTTSPKVRALMSCQVVRASALLDAGSPLIGSLRGAGRLAVAGYVAGGRAALAAIESAGHDVLAATPHPRQRRLVAELAKAYLRGR